MERMNTAYRRSVSLTVVFFMLLSFVMPSFVFSSDYDNHWAKEDIDFLSGKGIVNGSEDGMRPDDGLTRAELVKIMNKTAGFTEQAQENFPDVNAEAWYANEMKIAKKAGYIKGDQDGNANPDGVVTRAEVMVMQARIYKLDTSDTALFYADNADVPDWAAGAVNALVKNGIIQGYADNTIRANAAITRAEGFSIVARVFRSSVSNQGKPPVVSPTATPTPGGNGGNIIVSGGGSGSGSSGGSLQTKPGSPSNVKLVKEDDKYLAKWSGGSNTVGFEISVYVDGVKMLGEYTIASTSFDVSKYISPSTVSYISVSVSAIGRGGKSPSVDSGNFYKLAKSDFTIAAKGNNTYQVSVKDQTNADHYAIKLVGSDKSILEGVSTKSSFMLSEALEGKKLAEGISYEVTVQDKGTYAFPSEWSTAKTITTENVTPPAEVTALEGAKRVGSAFLQWVDPKDTDFEKVIISVYSQDQSASIPLKTREVVKGVQQMLISELTGGTTYTFKIQTVDTAGNKSVGTMVDVMPVTSNSAPVVQNPVGEQKAVKGTEFILDISAVFSDPDEDDVLTYSANIGSIDSDGIYHMTFNENKVYNIILTAEDSFVAKKATAFLVKVTESSGSEIQLEDFEDGANTSWKLTGPKKTQAANDEYAPVVDNPVNGAVNASSKVLRNQPPAITDYVQMYKMLDSPMSGRLTYKGKVLYEGTTKPDAGIRFFNAKSLANSAWCYGLVFASNSETGASELQWQVFYDAPADGTLADDAKKIWPKFSAVDFTPQENTWYDLQIELDTNAETALVYVDDVLTSFKFSSTDAGGLKDPTVLPGGGNPDTILSQLPLAVSNQKNDPKRTTSISAYSFRVTYNAEDGKAAYLDDVGLATASGYPPVINAPVSDLEIPLYETKVIDVTKVFGSADGSALTYTYQINGGTAQKVTNGSFSLPTSEVGTYRVTLTAQGEDRQTTAFDFNVMVYPQDVNLKPMENVSYRYTASPEKYMLTFDATAGADSYDVELKNAEGAVTSLTGQTGTSVDVTSVVLGDGSLQGIYTVSIIGKKEGQPVAVGEGTIDSRFGGKGANGEFLVWNERQLNNVRQDLAADYLQMADISITTKVFVPLGYNTATKTGENFQGSYKGANEMQKIIQFAGPDGNGITTVLADNITRFGLFWGLQGNQDKKVEIENITFTGKINHYATNAAALATAVTYTELAHCYNEADINATDFTSGLIVGVGAAGNVTLKSCHNSGSVSGKATVGGLVSNVAGPNNLFEECYNSGAVTGTGSAVGGIFGRGPAPNTTSLIVESGDIIVKNCYNTGVITAKGTGKGGYSAGGITSEVGGNSQIINCYNYGKIAGQSVAASFEIAKNMKINTATISDCYYVDHDGVATVAPGGANDSVTKVEKANALQADSFATFDKAIWQFGINSEFDLPELRNNPSVAAVDIPEATPSVGTAPTVDKPYNDVVAKVSVPVSLDVSSVFTDAELDTINVTADKGSVADNTWTNTFADAGIYTVKLTGTDKDGSVESTFTVIAATNVDDFETGDLAASGWKIYSWPDTGVFAQDITDNPSKVGNTSNKVMQNKVNLTTKYRAPIAYKTLTDKKTTKQVISCAMYFPENEKMTSVGIRLYNAENPGANANWIGGLVITNGKLVWQSFEDKSVASDKVTQTWVYYYSDATVETGKWNNFRLVVDCDNNEAEIYFNGEKVTFASYKASIGSTTSPITSYNKSGVPVSYEGMVREASIKNVSIKNDSPVNTTEDMYLDNFVIIDYDVK